MRKLLLLFLFIISYEVWAQDYNYSIFNAPSVAGVTLGDSYESVISSLDERFDKYRKDSKANTVTYYNVDVGGIYYRYAAFTFIYKRGRKVLNTVKLYNVYELNEVQKAKDFRDYVAQVYGKKYKDMQERIGQDGFKYYVCNLNKVNDIFWIIIDIEKAESYGGKKYYYASTLYGPMYDGSMEDI